MGCRNSYHADVPENVILALTTHLGGVHKHRPGSFSSEPFHYARINAVYIIGQMK